MPTTPTFSSPPRFNLYKPSEVDTLEAAENRGAQEFEDTEVGIAGKVDAEELFEDAEVASTRTGTPNMPKIKHVFDVVKKDTSSASVLITTTIME